jgi:hypothetical protein
MTMSGVIGRGWWWLLGKKTSLGRMILSLVSIKGGMA